MEHDPYRPPGEDCNEERQGGNNRGRWTHPLPAGDRERSRKQCFRDIQQELSHMKETVKGRAPVFIGTLVQQTESPFTSGVLHFPLPAKSRMPQIETFDGTKDPVEYLSTYKN